MKRSFGAAVWLEGGCFIAQADDVDVARQGETESEALSNLKEALELYYALGGDNVEDDGVRGAVPCQIYIDKAFAREYPYSRIPVGAVVKRCNARAPYTTLIDGVSVRVCDQHGIAAWQRWGENIVSICGCGKNDPRVRTAYTLEVDVGDGETQVERAITYFMAHGSYYGMRGADGQVCAISQGPGGSWVLGMTATDESTYDSLEGAKDAAESMVDAAVARSNAYMRVAMTRTYDPVRDAFAVLADDWVANRPRGVDVVEMTAHPAYQAIIAMGEPAVYWILKRLETNPDHWFVALKAITSASPVPFESWGNMEEMMAAWFDWGRERGYAEPVIAPNSTYDVFSRLADMWEEKTALLSSSAAKIAHPAHRAIVAMGRPVGRHILLRMEAQGGHWFHALEAIYDGSPVPEASLGDVEAMQGAWLDWGRGTRRI